MRLILPERHNRRLRGKCFRGARMRAFAGAFALWGNFDELLDSEQFIAKLRDALRERLQDRRFGVHRLELKFDQAIGWDSLVELDELDSDEIEACIEGPPHPRQRARWHGKFMPVGVTVADLTDVMTIVVDIQPGRDGCTWGVFVYTMYPGHDIGDLQGDMTEKTGAVFLDFMNPGETYVENIDEP